MQIHKILKDSLSLLGLAIFGEYCQYLMNNNGIIAMAREIGSDVYSVQVTACLQNCLITQIFTNLTSVNIKYLFLNHEIKNKSFKNISRIENAVPVTL